MPGVVWETTGMALLRTASFCFRYMSCRRCCFLGSCERSAEAFFSRASRRQPTVLWRRDSGLHGGPRGPRGFGQGGGRRGSLRRAPRLGLSQASSVPEADSREPLSLHRGLGPCRKEALWGRQQGGLHGLRAGPSPSWQAVQALCGPEACPAKALQGRCRKGPSLSGGLPGLCKEGSSPGAAHVLCGLEACLGEALQGR